MDDKPFSEVHFKTLKYRPDFQARYGCVKDECVLCRAIYDWYNHVRRHAGISLMTLANLHVGRVSEILVTRRAP